MAGEALRSLSLCRLLFVGGGRPLRAAGLESVESRRDYMILGGRGRAARGQLGDGGRHGWSQVVSILIECASHEAI